MPAFRTDQLEVRDVADQAKRLRLDLSGLTAATKRTLIIPDANGTIALTSTIDVARTWATLQKFKDTVFLIGDDGDITKALVFSLGGATSGKTLTLLSSHTLDRTITLPNVTGTLPTLENAHTVTGDWTFGSGTQTLILGGPSSSDVVKIAVDPSGAYVGAGILLDEGSGFLGQIGTASVLTANRNWNLPNLSGTLVTGTGPTITVMTVTSSALCSTISSGFSLADSATNSKRLRFITSGCTASINTALAFVSTAARTYTYQDYTSSVVVVGNAAAAAGVLGRSALTGQTANITATTLLTSSANSSGLFRVSFYVKTTTAGTPAVATVKITVAYNDGTAQTADVLLSNLIATPAASLIGHDLGTANNASFGELIVKASASTAITYTTTGTYTGGAAYSLDARIEALG